MCRGHPVRLSKCQTIKLYSEQEKKILSPTSGRLGLKAAEAQLRAPFMLSQPCKSNRQQTVSAVPRKQASNQASR